MDGEAPIQYVSIPYVISMLTTNYFLDHIVPRPQENGRDIWDQMAKKLLRT